MTAASPRRFGTATFLAAVLILGVGATGAAAQATLQGSEAAVARAYFDEARQRAAEGDWSGASSLLSAAEEMNPADSDVRYLSALASIQRGGFPGESLRDIDAAIAADRFSYYHLGDAVSLRAELLIRSGRYTEALDVLQALPKDADTSWMRCRALEGLDRTGSFDEEMRSALDLYPDDPRFPRLFLESLGWVNSASPRSSEEASLGDTILARLSAYSVLDPELPVLAAPIMPRQTDRVAAVAAFRAAGAYSERATLLALEYGLADQKTASAELFSGRYQLTLFGIEEALALAKSAADRELLAVDLDAYSGTLEIEKRGGVLETALLKSGRPVSWSRSYDDERGHISYDMDFSNEEPTDLVVSIPDSSIKVAYAVYPYCSTISFSNEASTTEYRFDPEAFFFAPVRMRHLLGSGLGERFVPEYTEVPLPTQTACASSALEIITSTPGSRQVTKLEHGIPLRRVTWKDGRVYSVLSYERGLPSIERVDEDGDGRFETERIYATDDAGISKPEWILVDTKGSGIFDYREQTVFPFRKEWDFDDNGSIDAIQYQRSDGSIVREFSTKMDGNFDEKLIIESGRIVSFTKNGKPVRLIPDANPGLTWIGSKPFDYGSNVPAGDGVFPVRNMRIRIIHVASQVFAEIIP